MITETYSDQIATKPTKQKTLQPKPHSYFTLPTNYNKTRMNSQGEKDFTETEKLFIQYSTTTPAPGETF